ncbi:hypothetical protein P0D73_38220 [Paraburkholderia sp. RL18-101-BIB-B]|uniref:hypothetical protein n=1 Tax=Paraburkholderia sp. RL18-101-BIB-B TaxID=3031634 RepID=UPI0038BB966A
MLDLRPRATFALLLATGLAAAATSAVAAPPVGGTLSRSTTLSPAGKWSSPTATNDHGKTRSGLPRIDQSRG